MAMSEGRTPGHWKLAGTILWGLVIAIVYFLLQVGTILFFALGGKHGLTPQQIQLLFTSSLEDGTALSVATFITTLAGCGLIAGVIKLKRGSILADYLALKAVPARIFLPWVGILVLFLLASDLLTLFLGRPIVPDYIMRVYASARPVWMIWAAFVVAAPLFEESFFRGFLFRGFASSFMGPRGAIALTSGLWAVIHAQYDAYGIATIFCFGLLLGSARLRTRSLLAPIAMHAMANFAGVVEDATLS